MAAVTVLSIEQGWAGDRKRHLAAILLTSGYTVTPAQVGLKKIDEIIQPALRLGDFPINGTHVTLTDCGVITGTYSADYCTLTSTGDGNTVLYFYGW